MPVKVILRFFEVGLSSAGGSSHMDGDAQRLGNGFLKLIGGGGVVSLERPPTAIALVANQAHDNEIR